MAEIAIACLTEKITEAVAAAAFRRLDSLMKPSGKVRGKMVQIGRELEVMNEFLRCTSAYRGDHEQPLSTWAKQIQDVAYEIEDIIDEYNYIVAGRSWGGLAAYIYNAFNDIHKARALCDVINNLEATEASLADLWRMRSMYDIKIPQKTTTNGPSDEGELSRRLAELAHFMEEDELVGFDGHKDALIKWLVSGDPRRGTASVLGMGGVGKTTLVTSVYKDQTITDHFSCRAWVSVSQNYTTEEVLRKILRELHQERMEEELPQHEIDSMEYRRLVETLRSYLHHKRYLVVLDDVWHADLWNDISYTLLDNRCGSRIVITTRNQEVSSAATNGCVVRVDPLPEQTAWILFCMKAFPGEDGNACPPELECWARRMVDRCEGLPLAIVSIANLLSQKERLEPVWKMVHDSLTWSTTTIDNTRLHTVSRILSLSIRDLPHDLRNCLLHCSMFPEDYPIGRSRLIRLWVAEGFVKGRGQRTMEEVAEDYLNQLVGRCLVHVTHTNESGRIQFCRVHDLVRELIMAKSKDEHFAEAYDGRPENMSQRVRRLSITNGGQEAYHHLKRRMPLLRSFHWFSPVSASLISSCRLLRVLDLCSAPVEVLPDEVVCLFNLRYLSIRRTKVRTLPRSLGNLRNLETLDAVHTHIEELPSGVAKLENLRHLMVKKFHRQTSRFTVLGGGVKVPGGIGNLKGLQTLKAAVADDGMIRHLKKMTQMRSLDMRGVTTIHSVDLSMSISKMEHLHRLILMANHKDDTLLLANLTPPPRLRKLSLYGKLEKGMLPHWFDSLANLTHLVLKMSRLREDAVSALVALSNLVSLFLMQAFEGNTLRFPAGSLCKLKSLGLCDMAHLNCIEIEETALESLQELTLVRCSQLQTIPRGIQSLTGLQKLELEDMPDELVEKLRECRQHYQSIPIIKIWNHINGSWIVKRLSCPS
ncbi:unnamed protein product [Musa textilis]